MMPGSLIFESLQKTQKRIEEIDYSLAEVDKNPGKYIQDKLNKLEEDIAKLPDRKPKHKNNITMKEHLQNIKKDVVLNPDKYINDYKSKLLLIRKELENGSRDI